jgi:hypothetical protein
MLHLRYVLLATARSSLKLQRELALENLALRQQLAIVHRKTKRRERVLTSTGMGRGELSPRVRTPTLSRSPELKSSVTK